MSFREMAYPVETSEEVIISGVNFFPTFTIMRNLFGGKLTHRQICSLEIMHPY